MNKVLLIDDEIDILKDKSAIIKKMGHDCLQASNVSQAIEQLHRYHPDVILTDQNMPEQDGFVMLEATKLFDPTIPVIFFTGYGNVDSSVKAMKKGAFDYIQKPLSPQKLKYVLQKAQEEREAKQLQHNLRQPKDKSFLKGFIGKSKPVQEVTERVLKSAQCDSNILIYGESGTGKELIAQNIHLHSQRKTKPFVPLDCVSLPSTLLESEIFGFEQGSFTGASRAKPGIFEVADGGTLFLDEIAELEVHLQAKLLRVLQERKLRRVGGKKIISIDVRIISATNQIPQQAVDTKTMRKDLYYRLNVIPIFIPPLRDRKEDIPLLVEHFRQKINPSLYHKVKRFSPDALEALKNYSWPGNVRELENVVQQVMSLSDSDEIYLSCLPECIRVEQMILDKDDSNLSFKDLKKKYVNRFCMHYFSRLMKKHRGNISKVAQEAGLSRKTVYDFLHSTGLK